LQINKYLVSDLKALGLWSESLRNEIKLQEGSIQDMVEIPEQIKKLYRTVWELPMKALIDMAAARGPFIDQSQSLNLFSESPTIGKLSSMYMYAWKQGVKTTYYLRSRPATRIAKTTVRSASSSTLALSNSEPLNDEQRAEKKTYSEAEIIACSIENPEACEACQ
jgi:ribonucleoside-diphosphate reductase alpha chain